MVKSNRKILHKLLLVGAELLVLAHCKEDNDKNSQVKVSDRDKKKHNYIS